VIDQSGQRRTGGSETSHPYIANGPTEIAEMLAEIGASTVDELFEQIPVSHRLRRPLDLPPQLGSEAELGRHVAELLRRTTSCERTLSFLGAGCYRHHVPAICDDIAARQEWLMSVWGTPSSDHGRFQAWFEYASQLGELLDLDFVGLPVYSWGCAAGHALRMAGRMTGRKRVLLPRILDPERRAVITAYCGRPDLAEHLEIQTFDYDESSARLDIDNLCAQLDSSVAAVYIESPNYLGQIEDRISDVVGPATSVGAEVILGVDPLTLGVLAPPGELGVGIAVGTTQTLGVHMNAGGGTGGFIASRDEERYAREYPTLQVSIAPTIEPGERGYGIALFDQTSYGAREQANDWTGNSVYLWAIVNAAYMAALGPDGFVELGTAILRRSHDAAARLGELPGVVIRFQEGFFQEFVVDFTGTGRRVVDIHAELRRREIFGGVDLSRTYRELGQSALYCVSELHSAADIDQLVATLSEVLR